MKGLLLVDKPAGMTSHDVVDRIRRAAHQRRVGHTGTLDPAATGLLVICLGPATRLSEHLTSLDKEYIGIMRLGVVSGSYDLDGEILEENPVPALSAEDIQEMCNRYTGDIEQVPPMVSAVKVGGVRLYKAARKGQTVERPPRKVTVHAFDVLGYQAPDAQVRVRCTSGTYVRSLCHDVGRDIGCGGVLATLRRTRVGNYTVDDAMSVDHFDTPESVTERLLTMDDALDLPEVVLRKDRRTAVASGNTLTPQDLRAPCPVQEGWVQIKTASGALLALGVVERSAMGPRIHPKRVFTG